MNQKLKFLIGCKQLWLGNSLLSSFFAKLSFHFANYNILRANMWATSVEFNNFYQSAKIHINVSNCCMISSPAFQLSHTYFPLHPSSSQKLAPSCYLRSYYNSFALPHVISRAVWESNVGVQLNLLNLPRHHKNYAHSIILEILPHIIVSVMRKSPTKWIS